MKFSSSIALLLSAVVVSASSLHDTVAVSARHSRLSRSVAPGAPLVARAATAKRCPNRKGPKSNNTDIPVANNVAPAANKDPAPAPVSPNTNGLIKVQGNCGPNGATSQITTVTGPNGALDWLNCGLESDGGWHPPHVRVEDVVTQPLHTALANPNSPFQACGQFIWMFEKYANEYGIPPIMMASFAMQESSCNPETVGGGGEQGLMQITEEKCVGAPGGNCRDPEFNIRTATKFFADTLKRHNGNVLLAVGSYNGWFEGLTLWKAKAAANTGCCRCQNNADYLFQYFNGWCQNINAYDSKLRLGRHFNLDVCNK